MKRSELITAACNVPGSSSEVLVTEVADYDSVQRTGSLDAETTAFGSATEILNKRVSVNKITPTYMGSQVTESVLNVIRMQKERQRRRDSRGKMRHRMLNNDSEIGNYSPAKLAIKRMMEIESG